MTHKGIHYNAQESVLSAINIRALVNDSSLINLNSIHKLVNLRVVTFVITTSIFIRKYCEKKCKGNRKGARP